MIKHFHLVFLFALGQVVFSQTINGVVSDENGQALMGASVYFNGTSIGTISDAEGKFSLSVENLIEPELVVSFLGYNSVNIPNPGTDLLKIKLFPDVNSIEEVVFTTDGFSREEKLKVFKEMFLGQGEAAAQCVIINENDLQFNYDLKKNMMFAKSDKTLIIQNKYLGYDVLFDLKQFELIFKQKSISSEDVTSFYFYGNSYFIDKPMYEKRYKKNRIMAYRGSTREFFKYLAEGKLKESTAEKFNYRVRIHNDTLKEVYRNFSIVRHKNYYEVFMLPSNNFISTQEQKSSYFAVIFRIWYNDKVSSLQIKSSKFSIDNYGNTNLFNKLTLYGDMSRRRVALMLPKNYLPNEQ